MKNCLLIVDSNERFHDDEPYDYLEFGNDIGWIYLECQHDENTGVIYNGKVVFSKDEISPFFKAIEAYDGDSEGYDDEECYNFVKNNSHWDWYYFYCTPNTDDWSQKDFDYLSNRVLVRPEGFILHKNGKDYKIGHTGAHVHLNISH